MRSIKASRVQFSSEIVQILQLRTVQILLGLIGLGSLINWLMILSGEQGLFRGSQYLIPVVMVASIFMIWMIRNGRYVVPVGSISVIYLVVISSLSFSDNLEVLLIMFLLAILGAALIAPPNVYWLVNALVIGVAFGVILLGDALETNSIEGMRKGIEITITLVFSALPPIVGLIVRYFVDSLEITVGEAQRTATLLEASANIGQTVSQMLEVKEMLNRAVEIMRDRFAFYHVQIFLVDEEFQHAHLAASTGELGEQLLARGYRVQIDSANVVGRVVLSEEPIIARKSGAGEGKSSGDLLADTRSQLAIPIQDTDGVIGVIDVHSRVPDSFTDTEIRVLSVIANQLATATRNARLFERQAKNIRENKHLFIEAETNLREIQRLNRQLTRQSWTDYQKADRRMTGVSFDGREITSEAEWSEAMLEAGQRRRPISGEKENLRTVAVPIELRGEVVGAVEIETSHTDHFDDTVDMMQAITQRLAVSLDNARLLEELQEATAQEQQVSALVARYQSADTVDELLQITLEGLLETLHAEEGTVRLGILPEDMAGQTEQPNDTRHVEGGVS